VTGTEDPEECERNREREQGLAGTDGRGADGRAAGVGEGTHALVGRDVLGHQSTQPRVARSQVVEVAVVDVSIATRALPLAADLTEATEVPPPCAERRASLPAAQRDRQEHRLHE
jgi:hypothetical protein